MRKTSVSGIVKPGSLCAIMGASGSGKTTLLNVLNFQNDSQLFVEGDVKVNGQNVTWKDLSKYSAYVQQDDLYIATLKVREHLTFLVGRTFGNASTSPSIISI
jgi:ABC-type multidrug transport system ATPase subunit